MLLCPSSHRATEHIRDVLLDLVLLVCSDHSLTDSWICDLEIAQREIFYTLTEAKVLIERWRQEYNTIRPHSSLGYKPPAPEVLVVAPLAGSVSLRTLATLRPPAGTVDAEGLT